MPPLANHNTVTKAERGACGRPISARHVVRGKMGVAGRYAAARKGSCADGKAV